MNGFFDTNIDTLYKDDADFYFDQTGKFYQAWFISDLGLVVSCDTLNANGYISMYVNAEEVIGDFGHMLDEEEKKRN